MRVAGLGFRRQVSLASLLEVMSRVQFEHGKPDALATSVSKSDAGPLQLLALTLGLPLLSIEPEQLARQETHTQSARQQGLFGTGSLAEAAALAAAGPEACLLLTRIVSADGMATAALALASPLNQQSDNSNKKTTGHDSENSQKTSQEIT
ncbi:cobalamin biosynthesis protein [Granulosicoccus antarcticus]|uniref:CobE/GbiG C-terminal domain-containing protein n=1 Tax=Granulosicoccus antarcticus IMCC3135 TaxID=1192854 RepID=A0A2Z2NL67_9GAMM|nr:cobalamin biosynthesis protein [Granulosicoccus antarcticus]ASJ71889.1 hypothetical protein IMCC3135_08960 [Granulosicoccus antarcticus IMCC3135]